MTVSHYDVNMNIYSIYMNIQIRTMFILCGLALALAQERPFINPNATNFSGVVSFNWTAGYCYAMMGTQN
jgi:hypothetical protein